MHCAIDRNACSQAIICIASNSEIINCNDINNNVWLFAAAIMQNSYCDDINFKAGVNLVPRARVTRATKLLQLATKSDFNAC
jgi:hypothetical protein